MAERNKKEQVILIQNLPGRVRLRFPNVEEAVPDIDRLLEIEGVEEVTFNIITKSLLIIYDEHIISEKTLLKRIGEALPQYSIGPGKSLKVTQTDQNTLSKVFYETMSGVNKKVRKGTRGSADLTSMVPLLLLLWGVEELVRNPVMPKWYDIIRASESLLSQFKKGYEPSRLALH